MISALFSILNWIICLVVGFFYLIADGIIWAVNMIIVGLAAAITAILLLLPNMPALPVVPAAFLTAEGWVAWFWPVATTVDILAFLLAAWLIWLGVAILLRWGKVIST